MKLRYLPNAVSITRILLCIPLIFLTPFSLVFIVLFAVAGVTDSIDGQLARRIKGGTSELGASIDSIADLVMVSVLIFVIMPAMQIWGWLWVAYVSVLSLKVVASTGIGFIRFKEFISLHTISFKILVAFLFTYPFVYYFAGEGLFINVFSTVLISCALLVVIEEILIVSTLKKPERDIRSIFAVKSANRAANHPVEIG